MWSPLGSPSWRKTHAPSPEAAPGGAMPSGWRRTTPPICLPWSTSGTPATRRAGALSAAGFLRMLGDETDAIATLYFLNDAAQRFHARATLKDDENPIAKLRYLEIRQGRLPSGMPIEDVLAARPVIKKMEGEPITFYPPTYRPNSYFRRDKPGMWGFSLKGIRDFAPSFLEAEAEAMRIYRGFRRLNP